MFNDQKLKDRALMFRDWGRIGNNSEARRVVVAVVAVVAVAVVAVVVVVVVVAVVAVR